MYSSLVVLPVDEAAGVGEFGGLVVRVCYVHGYMLRNCLGVRYHMHVEPYVLLRYDIVSCRWWWCYGRCVVIGGGVMGDASSSVVVLWEMRRHRWWWWWMNSVYVACCQSFLSRGTFQ